MLEERFTNLAADQAMAVPGAEGEIDPISEEFKLVSDALRESTTKLIRQFSKRENLLLLKQFEYKSKEENEV
jgi:hypothetical protein